MNMKKSTENNSLKKQLLGLAETPKAYSKGGSGYTTTALMKNYASPRDPSIFDGEEIGARELRIRTEIEQFGMERRGKPVFLTPNDTKLSLILSTCLNTNDPDIEESDGLEVHKEEAKPKRTVFQGFDAWFLMNVLNIVNT